MTPAEIITDVRSQFSDNTANFVSDSEFYTWIWEALYKLNLELDLIEGSDTSITTVASTASYTVPEAFQKIYMVLWNSKRLIKKGLIAFQNLTGDTPPEGTPRYYKQFGKQITLHPIPSDAQTVTIYGIKRPTKITAANVTTDLYTSDGVPEQYQEMISDYVLWRLYLKDDDKKAIEHQNNWLNNLQDARMTWQQRQTDDETVLSQVVENGIDESLL